MYRQLTLKAINTPGGITAAGPADGLRRRRSGVPRIPATSSTKGARVVLIGHSQGSAMLESSDLEQIDPNPTLRKQLVSAILLGGNVLVPEGQTVGRHVPATSRSAPRQPTRRCVIAYSSFLKEPPEDSFFGRPDSALLGGTPPPGMEVAVRQPDAAAPERLGGNADPRGADDALPGHDRARVPDAERSNAMGADDRHRHGAVQAQRKRCELAATSPPKKASAQTVQEDLLAHNEVA